MLNNIITYFQKKVFIYKIKKIGEVEYFKKYCGVESLKCKDCKHETKLVCTIPTNKGDINSLYCTQCGAILMAETLLNNLTFEYAKAMSKSNKRKQKQDKVLADKELEDIN